MTSEGKIRPSQITVSAIYTNTELTLIEITEDKLRLQLMLHLATLESKNRWQFPLGVLLALAPVFLTSDFKDAFYIEKATWKAVFLFAAAGAFLWVLWAAKGVSKSVTVNELVASIKNVGRNET